MGYLIEGYKIMGKEIGAYAVQHRAGIGTAVSVGGTIISNILSTNAGAKSARMIDQKQLELGRSLSTMEKVKLCWKNHIGSIGTAAASCVGAGYSHNQHVKDFEKAAMAYSGLKKLYESGKQATKEVIGEKKAMEVQDRINQKRFEEHPELAEKAQTLGPNPDPSTMQTYFETASGEYLYQTLDGIKMAVSVMQSEMKALHPRKQGTAMYRGVYGVKLRRFHELANKNISKEKLNSKIMNEGWNKGKETNGSDDDKIEFYITPMMIEDENGEPKAVLAINWAEDPSDMTMGDYMKF